MAGIEDIYADIAEEVKRENQVRGSDSLPNKKDLQARLREPNPDAMYAKKRRFRDTE